MTLTELKYITAVARHRHFGRAAEKCFVSQPTLSIAVKKLEEELGVQIFERGKSEVTLTPIGSRIVEQAQQVLEQADVIRQLAQQGQDQLKAPLNIGVIYTIGPYLLPHLIPLLHERAPDMNLILREDYTHNLGESLKTGELDAVIVALPFQRAGVVAEPLYDEPFVVAMPSDHPWTKRETIRPDQLGDQTVLLLSSGNCFREQVLEACPTCRRMGGALDGALQKTLEGSSLETIRQMAATGAGVTVMPCTSAGKGADLQGMLTFRPFEEPVPFRRVALAYRASFPRPRAIEALREAIAGCPLPCVRKLPAGTRHEHAEAVT